MSLFQRLSPDEIETRWGHIEPLLAPAIAHDAKRHPWDVYDDLLSGKLEAFDIDMPKVRGIAVTEIGLSTSNARCCWVVYIGGEMTAAPHEWLSRTRVLMKYFEEIAEADGCTEMRVEGRDWSRILLDYEQLHDRPGRNELRKML